jgi:hypothetical protein
MSLPKVLDELELVHSVVQGEFEETCSEMVVCARKRTARRELISIEAMVRFGFGQVSGSAFLETPFEDRGSGLASRPPKVLWIFSKLRGSQS